MYKHNFKYLFTLLIFILFLSRVFYVIDQMHKTKRVYIYDDDAQKVAVKFYNEQQEFLRENHSTDTYISGKPWVLLIDFFKKMLQKIWIITLSWKRGLHILKAHMQNTV